MDKEYTLTLSAGERECLRECLQSEIEDCMNDKHISATQANMTETYLGILRSILERTNIDERFEK